MYYFPYLVCFINLLSFTHHNNINENINNNSHKQIDLWSISRWSYIKYKGIKTFTASYNNFAKNYEFDGKRYLSYNDVINTALNV